MVVVVTDNVQLWVGQKMAKNAQKLSLSMLPAVMVGGAGRPASEDGV